MIGARIAELRAQKGMTQEHLAGEMGISPKYLSSIERGKENPTLNTIIALSEALNVDLGEILPLRADRGFVKKKVHGLISHTQCRR
jgi:transcriptional regulator with XRE-family HTH domain